MSKREDIGIDVYGKEPHIIACSKNPDALSAYANDKYPRYSVEGLAYTGGAELCIMLRDTSWV